MNIYEQPYITATIIIVIIVIGAIFYHYLFSASGEDVVYLEVPLEDEDGEPIIPEDVKYRADWLTVLLNYLILKYDRWSSEEPKISSFKPEDGVSMLRIADHGVQFTITVYWFKRKVALTGFIMSPTGFSNDAVKIIRYAFKWKGYDVPYQEVDCFINKVENVEEKIRFDEIEEVLRQREVNQLLIQKLVETALEEKWVLPEDKVFDLQVEAVLNFLDLIPKIKNKKVLNSYLAFLSILVASFVKEYGANWLQNFSLDTNVIGELLEKINKVDDDEAAEEEDD